MPKSAPTTTETVDLLRRRLGEWYLALNPSYTYVHYQQDRLIPALERHFRRQGAKRKLMVMVHTGASKTEIGTLAGATWYMGKNPAHNVQVLSYGDDLAEEFGGKIRDICNRKLTHSVFPGLKLLNQYRGAKHFKTEQGNEFWSAGFCGTVTGHRLNAAFIDDPVKNMEEADSPAEMSRRFNIYRSVVDSRLRPGGIVVAFLTRYGQRDWAARVLEHEGDEWDILLLDAENQDGTYLWQDFFGATKYETIKRKDPQVWWSVWRQQPQAYVENYFHADWWLTYKPGDVKRTWNTYMICDPAISTHTKADRTSIPVFAAGPERRLFIVDWVYDRMDPDQRSDAIVRLIRKWKPRQFAYEEFGLNSDIHYLTKRFVKERITLRPIPVGRHGTRSKLSKDQRIRELMSDFREGLLWFPEKLMYTCVNGETIDVMHAIRTEEYLPYRGEASIPYDDGLDALSRIHEPELHIRYVPEPDGDMERRGRQERRGGWEANI